LGAFCWLTSTEVIEMTMPEVTKEFEIPQDVSVKIEGSTITVSGPKGTILRRLEGKGIQIEDEDGRIVMVTRYPSTRRVAIFGMQAAVIGNMLEGVTRGFQSRLKVISSHFPITTEVKEGQVLISNFLGERYPRKARIHEGVEVSVEGEFITVRGIDRDGVAQTAANIEQATVVRGRDRRVFQDGIYLVEKTSSVEG
jgi:large subunit ribosomal protein L6